MAKFAPTCPPQILCGLRNDGVMGHYHLLLAHDVVKRSVEYAEIFSRPFHGWSVIMDNSIVELGSATSLDTVRKAVEITHANVVVLPDVYGEGPETVESIKEALPIWHDAFKFYDHKPIQYMLVPQGRTLLEWVKCARVLTEIIDNADIIAKFWWGIPRIFQERLSLSRMIAVNVAHGLKPTWPIHLLGFSENVYDDFYTAKYKHVTGIDSAVPLRAATLNIPFEIGEKLPPRGDWWDTCEYIPKMAENVILTNKLLASTPPK